MQVQIKKQLKIELDEADIVAAVREYLLNNGYSISDTEAAKINFVKSPKDGLRAELNIVEETGVDAEVESPKQPTPILAIGTQPETQDEEEGPGEVATSTTEDVMPSLDEVKAMVEPEAVVAEEAAAEAEVKQEDSRKSLFL